MSFLFWFSRSPLSGERSLCLIFLDTLQWSLPRKYLLDFSSRAFFFLQLECFQFLPFCSPNKAVLFFKHLPGPWVIWVLRKLFHNRVLSIALLGITWALTLGDSTENFSSSQYFCRYCLISRTEFQGADPNLCGLESIPETYRSAIEQPETEKAPQVQGIMFRSVFNTLQNSPPHLHECPLM